MAVPQLGEWVGPFTMNPFPMIRFRGFAQWFFDLAVVMQWRHPSYSLPTVSSGLAKYCWAMTWACRTASAMARIAPSPPSPRRPADPPAVPPSMGGRLHFVRPGVKTFYRVYIGSRSLRRSGQTPRSSGLKFDCCKVITSPSRSMTSCNSLM